MMTKNYSRIKGILGKIAAVSLILLLAMTFAFSQKNEQINKIVNVEGEWWQPILKKHHIEPTSFNNFEDVFEMGTKNYIENGIAHLENALFIVKLKDDDQYAIVRCPSAYHDLDKKVIVGTKGTVETFSLKSNDLTPLTRGSSDGGLIFHLKNADSLQIKQNRAEQRQSAYLEEQKAAAIDQKLAHEELVDQKLLLEEQKAALIDQKLAKEEQIKMEKEQVKILEEDKKTLEEQKVYFDGLIKGNLQKMSDADMILLDK